MKTLYDMSEMNSSRIAESKNHIKEKSCRPAIQLIKGKYKEKI